MGGMTNGDAQAPVHSIQINQKDALNKKLGTQNTTTHQAKDNEEIANALSDNSKDGDEGPKQMQFPDDMTLLQCFWMVTKMAIPLVVGMLLYLLV